MCNIFFRSAMQTVVRSALFLMELTVVMDPAVIHHVLWVLLQYIYCSVSCPWKSCAACYSLKCVLCRMKRNSLCRPNLRPELCSSFFSFSHEAMTVDTQWMNVILQSSALGILARYVCRSFLCFTLDVCLRSFLYQFKKEIWISKLHTHMPKITAGGYFFNPNKTF